MRLKIYQPLFAFITVFFSLSVPPAAAQNCVAKDVDFAPDNSAYNVNSGEIYSFWSDPDLYNEKEHFTAFIKHQLARRGRPYTERKVQIENPAGFPDKLQLDPHCSATVYKYTGSEVEQVPRFPGWIGQFLPHTRAERDSGTVNLVSYQLRNADLISCWCKTAPKE